MAKAKPQELKIESRFNGQLAFRVLTYYTEGNDGEVLKTIEGRKRTDYKITPVDSGYCRRVILEKIEAEGTPIEEMSSPYLVEVAEPLLEGSEDNCTCQGFAKFKRCKHLAIVRDLTAKKVFNHII